MSSVKVLRVPSPSVDCREVSSTKRSRPSWDEENFDDEENRIYLRIKKFKNQDCHENQDPASLCKSFVHTVEEDSFSNFKNAPPSQEELTAENLDTAASSNLSLHIANTVDHILRNLSTCSSLNEARTLLPPLLDDFYMERYSQIRNEKSVLMKAVRIQHEKIQALQRLDHHHKDEIERLHKELALSQEDRKQLQLTNQRLIYQLSFFNGFHCGSKNVCLDRFPPDVY